MDNGLYFINIVKVFSGTWYMGRAQGFGGRGLDIVFICTFIYLHAMQILVGIIGSILLSSCKNLYQKCCKMNECCLKLLKCVNVYS